MASEPSPSATVSAAVQAPPGCLRHRLGLQRPPSPQRGPAAPARRPTPQARAERYRAAKQKAAGAGAGKRSGRVRVPDPAANAAFVVALAAEVDRELPVVLDVITDEWWAAARPASSGAAAPAPQPTPSAASGAERHLGPPPRGSGLNRGHTSAAAATPS